MMNEIKKELPIIILADTVLLNNSESVISFNSTVQKNGESILKDNAYVVGLAVKPESDPDNFDIHDFYRIGTLIHIQSVFEKGGSTRLSVNVLDRVNVHEITVEDNEYIAHYDVESDIHDLEPDQEKELLGYMKDVTKEIGKMFDGSEQFIQQLLKVESIDVFMSQTLPYINAPIDQKQQLLTLRSQRERAFRHLDLQMAHKESLKFQMEMAQRFNKSSNQKYREVFLREQLKAIQEELGEGESKSGKKDYREQIENSKMTEEVRKVALSELAKLERQGPQSAEGNVIRTYLELLIELPWEKQEAKDINIKEARALLDKHHYGLDKVKNRIIQHLSVMKLKKDKQGSILLLVGPPGTGKTSLGKSIAEALDRKYIRASLGGMRDEAEIRGHRRTYIGALPGRIIKGMKKAGETNPVFVLDEIDKLMTSYSGDPASALLEVLDPEQNGSFADHYLEVPYDLSDVFFIATANSLKGIPGPLLDRMEVIQVSGYTSNEKFHIGKDYLIKDVLEEHGMNDEQLRISDDTLVKVIDDYTREAGVRSLKRQLTTIARVASERVVSGDESLPITIEKEELQEVLGNPVARHEKIGAENPIGTVTGLAWTPVGGEILFIETAVMPGKGQLMLTGQLGDVMKESAKISESLIRSRLAFFTSKFDFSKSDIHVHVPSGAIPKDGPSAGVALFTSLASLVTGIRIPSELAMTGEVSLRGAVMPVGGIKEKVLAAHRAGIKRVILPKDNEMNIKDIPEEVREDLTFILVETVEDVLKETLMIDLPKPKSFLEFDPTAGEVMIKG